MKVALVVPSISFHDVVETPAVRLFAERLSSDVNLHVFPLFVPPGNTSRRSGTLTLHPAADGKIRFARRLAQTILAIRAEHERVPFDVLHALWLHEPGTIAVAAGTVLRIPVVASIGGAEVVALPDIAYGALRAARGRLMMAHVLQRASIVTGGSEYVLRKARRVVPHRDPARFQRAPLPVDTQIFTPQPRQRSCCTRSLQLVHAASLIPVKDQSTLLLSFRRVVDAIPDARLTIAGEDPFGIRADLERHRETLQLTQSVTFAGSVPHQQMPDLYRDADLHVLSSRHESQAMVVLEAAASGIATVGTAVGVVPDLAPECAIAVRPGDPVALADAVISLLRDPARLQRMGALARQRAVEEYGTATVCDRFTELYARAIGRRRI